LTPRRSLPRSCHRIGESFAELNGKLIGRLFPPPFSTAFFHHLFPGNGRDLPVFSDLAQNRKVERSNSFQLPSRHGSPSIMPPQPCIMEKQNRVMHCNDPRGCTIKVNLVGHLATGRQKKAMGAEHRSAPIAKSRALMPSPLPADPLVHRRAIMTGMRLAITLAGFVI
jgi:hypothetical protein